MRKTFFLITVSFTSFFIALGQKQVIIDANAELRNLEGKFRAIVVSGGIDLYLSQAENEEIAVSAPEKIMKEVRTVVENGVLRILVTADAIKSFRHRKIKVYVAFNDLDTLAGSGASKIIVAGKIAVPAMLLKLSGSSDFRGEVAVDKLAINLSGASDVEISGTAASLNIESSGASDVKGFGLVTDYCRAEVSGASDVNVTVNKEISAEAHGSSGIYYKGNATIRQGGSGSSKIRRVER